MKQSALPRPPFATFHFFFFLISAVLLSSTISWGQSLTSGGIAGTVLDPSGAAVPGATLTLKNRETGATQTTTSNATGAYRFSLLNPGEYSVSASSQGFQGATENTVSVAVGQTATVNINLAVAAASTTVEVTGGGSVIQTENANVSTNITPEIIANMPNPGNDLTYYAQTAPGATMNTQAGFGNSATPGISGTSNLFTVDGMNENDPFLNLSNSGATNLLLGANDVREATVVNNGYSGEYGELAGTATSTTRRISVVRWAICWTGQSLGPSSCELVYHLPLSIRPAAAFWEATTTGGLQPVFLMICLPTPRSVRSIAALPQPRRRVSIHLSSARQLSPAGSRPSGINGGTRSTVPAFLTPT